MLISKFEKSDIDTRIKELEEMYNIILPREYKKFLLKYNGGKTPETEFRMNKVTSDIEAFYGLGNVEEEYCIERLKNTVRWKEWLSNGMFPIATNSFGDYIMISTEYGNGGRVYFYYHDKPSKYIELAESFMTFVKKCKSKKIGYIPTIEERKKDMIKLGKGNKITPEKIAGWQAEINEYANIHQEELVVD